MNANQIKDAIIAKARDKHLTQKQIAKMTGIEQANISRYFLSTPVTVPTTAFRLADALDLELYIRPKGERATPAAPDEENSPTTPPSEYGDQPDDPDAGVFEREPEPGEGMEEPAEPDGGER